MRKIIFLSLFLALLLAALHSKHTSRWVLVQLERRADAAGVVATASGFHYNLLAGRVEVDDLRLRAKTGRTAFFEAKKVQISWRNSRLWKFLGAISEVHVADGTFQMDVDPEGRSNLDFGASSGSSLPMGMPDRLLLDPIRFIYFDGTTFVDQPSLDLQFQNGSWAGQSRQPGHARVGNVAGAISEFRLQGTETSLNLRDLLLEAHGEAVNVQLGDGVPARLDVSAILDGKDNLLHVTQAHARSVKGQVDASGVLHFDDQRGKATLNGQYDHVTVKAHAQWNGTDFDTYTAVADLRSTRRDLQGEASLKLNAHSIQAFIRHVRGYGMRVSGRAALQLSNAQLSGSLQGDIPEIASLTSGSVSGKATLLASLSGTLNRPEVFVTATSANLGAGDLTGIQGEVKAHYRNDTVDILDSEAKWRGQAVHASGNIRVGRKSQIDLALNSDILDVSTLTSEMLSTPLEGKATLTGDVHGVLSDPNVDLQVTGTGLKVGTETLGAMEAKVLFRDGQFVLQRMNLNKGANGQVGNILASGLYDIHSAQSSISFRTDGFPFDGRFSPTSAHPVVVAGQGDFKGPLRNLSGSAAFTLKDDRGASLQSTFKAENGIVGVDLRSSVLEVEVPAGIFHGTLALQGSGPLAKPEEFAASVQVDDFTFKTPETTVTADGPVRLSWRSNGLNVEQANFRDEEGRLKVQGRLALNDSGDRLSVQGNAPASLVTFVRPELLAYRPGGSLRLDGTVGGTLRSPRVDGWLRLSGGSLRLPQTDEDFREIEGALSWNGGAFDLEHLTAKLGTGEIRASARADSISGPFRAELNANRVDPILLFHSKVQQLDSEISAKATIYSPTSSLHSAEAVLAVSSLELRSPAGSVVQEHPLMASMRHSILTLEEASLKSRLGRFTLGGTLNLEGDHAIDSFLSGAIDTSFLNVDPDLHLSGPLTTNIRVRGSLTAPDVRGELELRNGVLSLSRPAQLNADSFELHARLEGQSLQIERIGMDLNGGTVSGTGSFTFSGSGQGGALHLTGDNVFLNYPEGLQSASDFALHLKLDPSTPSLTGKVMINDSSYRNAFDIAALARSTPAPGNVSPGTGLAGRLKLDLALETDQPLTVDNNLGRLTADANLRVQGTLEHPGITGNLELEEGGQVNFAGRSFRVNQGRIDFTSANRVEPRFNLQAETNVSNYLVTLKLGGDEKNLDTNFQSEPSLTQEQILSLLFTGTADAAGKSGLYAQSQLVALLGSSVGGSVFGKVRNTLRLNEFRIDPRLIAGDKNPTARLTIGEAFTPSFRMTYSTDLANAQDQVWTAEYDWRKRFLARFYRGSDQSNRAELRQKFRFGGGPETGDYTQHASRHKLIVRRILIEGDPALDEKTIRKAFHLRVGKKYDSLRSHRDVDRLRKLYIAQGYVEVRIHSHRLVEGDDVTLSYNIQAGPPVEFRYETALDRRTRKAVLSTWQEGLSDEQRVSAAEKLVEERLKAKRFPLATGKVSIHEADGRKRVLVDVQAGPRYAHPVIDVPGLSLRQQAGIRSIARRGNTDIEAEVHPELVANKIVSNLRADGYLKADAKAAVLDQSPEGGHLELSVSAGPRFTVGTITFKGNLNLQEKTLRAALAIEPGDDYREDLPQLLTSRLQQSYWDAGFRDASAHCSATLDEVHGTVNLTLAIVEGVQLTLGSVFIQGVSETSEAFLKRRLTLEPQKPVLGSGVSQSRRNLLDSGAYNLVDFTFKPVPQNVTNTVREAADLVITVREPKPYRIDFGATYDTDRGFGGISDISVVNKLGEARTLGFRVTADTQAQDYRVYFSQPFLGKKRVISTASIFAQHQQVSIFDAYGQGLSLQRDQRFRKHWNTSYGYQFEHATVDVQGYGQLFNETTSSVIGTLSRDTRDKPLDATKGMFMSAAGEYGPHELGGSIGYFRAYTQMSGYIGLFHPRPLPFEEGRRSSRFILASNARAGVVNNIGEALLLPTDQFFAGGGTSIRGFSQNSIGPKDSSGNAVGGKVTLIFNNEFRFPVFKFFDGVAFVDNGNVWAEPSDVRFTDLRTGAGAGLRIRNPFVLVRFDYGLKIDRRVGESPGAFFFSIGQSF